MKRFIAAVLFPFLLASHAGAERALTLNEALEAGLVGNPEIRAFKGSLGAAGEDIGIARSHLLPKVFFEERFMRTTNPTLAFSSKLNQERFTQADFAITSLNDPDAINDFQTSISFEQPLYVRKANIGLKMAKEEYSAKNDDFERKKEEVAFNIYKAYLAVNTAGEFVTVTEKSVEDAKEHLRLAEVRYKAEMGLYSDVLRATTGLREAEQRLVSAKKNLEVAKRTLGLLLGLTEPVDVTDQAPQIGLKEFSYYSESALSRKDVRSLERRRANAENNVELAKSGYYPMLGVGGAYMFNDHSAPFGSDGKSWQVSAFLRWNIFDGTLRGHEASKAKYKEIEAAEYLSGLRKSVSFKVNEAYLAVEEAVKNAELAEAALKAAEEGERIVRKRYENSLSPMIDLLDAKLALDGARAGFVAKRNDYKAAIANLGFEAGTLLKDLNIE